VRKAARTGVSHCTFSRLDSIQVLSKNGFSGPYRRNSTSNCPLALVGTQFDSLPVGAWALE
jgi:hypothetical protein